MTYNHLVLYLTVPSFLNPTTSLKPLGLCRVPPPAGTLTSLCLSTPVHLSGHTFDATSSGKLFSSCRKKLLELPDWGYVPAPSIDSS